MIKSFIVAIAILLIISMFLSIGIRTITYTIKAIKNSRFGSISNSAWWNIFAVNPGNSCEGLNKATPIRFYTVVILNFMAGISLCLGALVVLFIAFTSLHIF